MNPCDSQKNIRKEISKRREINKKKRKERNASEKERLDKLYKERKEKIQAMVVRAVEYYKIKTTNEIKKRQKTEGNV